MMRPVSFVTLLYHSVYGSSDTGETYDVSADRFAENLGILREKGIRCLSLEDLDNPEGISVDSRKLAMLTFDDGRLDNHGTAFPILSNHSARAAFFVNPERVGSPGYMGWNHLADLDRHGMAIQSHGMTHRYLHLLAPSEVEAELAQSKGMIEDRIGKRVDFLSVPGGFYSRGVLDAAWRLGYRGIFTSAPGVDRIAGVPRRSIFHRYNVSRGTSQEQLACLVEQKPGIRIRHRAMHAIKGGVRMVLGTSTYHRLWETLRKRAE